MMDEITVHQDTTLNAGRWSIAFGLGGMIALLTAGMMYGTMRASVDTLQDDMRQVRAEMQTRESKDAVALMFGDLRARLSRIESLLDRSTGTTSTQRMP
jgi:hypothetical protein